MKRIGLFALIGAFLVSAAAARAADAAPAAAAPEPYSASEFPRWALDLRRAEAIAFGSLPFTLFLSSFAVDSYRCYEHDWDRAYAPWPFKTSGAVSMSEDEFKATFAVACAGAVLVAAVDFVIVSLKRRGTQRAAAERPKPSSRVDRVPAAPEREP